jgi:hypothetical protein
VIGPRALLAAGAAAQLGVAVSASRLGLGPFTVPGAVYGEGWGRMAVTAQVLRWLQGAAPVGHADLFAAPAGRPFWPVDPLLQALIAPVAAAVDLPTAWTFGVILLLWTAGLGPTALARSLGAAPAAAVGAGLLVQLSPFALQNAADGVSEALALGPLALAAAALARVGPTGWTGPAAAALAGLLLGASSPYYGVYLMVLCPLLAVARGPRAGLRGAAALGLGLGIAAAPLLLAESGPGGRLGQGRGPGGYALIAAPLVVITEHGPQEVRRPPAPPLRDLRPPASAPRLPTLPGGWGPAAAALLALTAARAQAPARRWGAAAVALFLLGPGPALLSRRLGGPRLPVGGLLGELFQRLPLLSALGNADRWLAPAVLAACAGAALAARGRARAAALLAILGLAAADAAPRLPLPAAWLPGPLPPAVDGPLSVFPSGDPPWWHPAVAPKEGLWIAAMLGAPSPFDYGRGGAPSDAALMLALARHSRAPVGADALLLELAESPATPLPHALLLLDERLEPAEAAGARAFLAGAGATCAWDSGRWSLWTPAAPPLVASPP